MKPLEPIVYVEPQAVKYGTAAKMLDCCHTTVWKLEKAGELESIRVGSDKRITVESIRRFVARQLATEK